MVVLIPNGFRPSRLTISPSAALSLINTRQRARCGTPAQVTSYHVFGHTYGKLKFPMSLKDGAAYIIDDEDKMTSDSQELKVGSLKPHSDLCKIEKYAPRNTCTPFFMVSM